jgi:hypothetical protein
VRLEPWVGVPVGCLVPIAVVAVVLVGVGVMIGSRVLGPPRPPASIEVRIIDESARGGPAVLSTQVVPLQR